MFSLINAPRSSPAALPCLYKDGPTSGAFLVVFVQQVQICYAFSEITPFLMPLNLSHCPFLPVFFPCVTN